MIKQNRLFGIGELSRRVGLSRSTLLHYEKENLLTCEARNEAGYRLYTQKQLERVQRIKRFREAGVSLSEVRQLLAANINQTQTILEVRLAEISTEIEKLKQQQMLTFKLLQKIGVTDSPVAMTKALWTDCLRRAGLDDAGMRRWHVEFESRAPHAHFDFLLSIGINTEEAQHIQQLSRTEWANEINTP